MKQHGMLRLAMLVGTLCAALLVSACGGGDSGTDSPAPSTSSSNASSRTTNGTALAPVVGTVPAGSNVLKVSVNSMTNVAMASITFCTPGSATSCVTVDKMQIDTGSVGVRVNASALAGLALPSVLNDAGYPAAECLSFLDSNVWGAVRSADITLGNEVAKSLPIQVISDTGIPSASASGCTASASLSGINGVIGVGYKAQDCGFTCTATTNEYFSCPPGATKCGPYKLPLTSQVANPVMGFAADNNGVIFDLPAIPTEGASTVTGALVFGIGTQGNNTPTGLTVMPVASQTGAMNVTLNGVVYPQSIVDSGTDRVVLADSGIATCSSGRYCPPATVTESASLSGVSGSQSKSTSFPIVSANTQKAGYANYVADSMTFNSSQVILGLPFFYGRTIAFGYVGANTSLGVGPFVAL